MEIMNIIEARHSVRRYLDKPIESEKRAVLDGLCRELNEKSGLKMQILYDEPGCFKSILSHYGLFSGVKNYISIVGPDNAQLNEKAGYYGEKLVLKAQEIGLNTCWVAVTHGKTKSVVGSGEKEAIIIALGYGKNEGRPHKSKETDKLAKITADAPDWYKDGVKAAILAPTGVNQQKFMIEQDGDCARITAPDTNLAKIDLGIVKCHFEMASGHKTL